MALIKIKIKEIQKIVKIVDYIFYECYHVFMDLVSALKNLGLTEKEAKVYTALLQLGQTTAYAVSIKSNLKKTTVYVTLENLIDKGFAQKMPRAKKALFVAINPEDLFGIVKTKIKSAEELLPELKALSKSNGHKIGAVYYEGLSGIREMYKKQIKTIAGEEYVGFATHQEGASAETIIFLNELQEEYKKAKIKRRAIASCHPSITKKYLESDFPDKYGINIKILPVEKYNSNITIEIFKNFTQIFSIRHLQGIVVDNPDVADVMRQIFELIWEKGSNINQAAKNQ